MANGGRTIDERERAIIDMIAQRLGTAMSVQSSWRTFDKRGGSLTAASAAEWDAGDEDGFATRSMPDTECLGDESQYLSVVRRDRRNPMLAEDKDEKGCKDDETDDAVSGASDGQEAMLAKKGSAILKAVKFRKPRKWRHKNFQIAPRIRRDLDAIAAVGFAKLAVPHEAILMLYATEDVPRYWPVVKRYGLQGNTSPAHVYAITDAMQAILFGNAELAQDKRASVLHMRASTYRAIRANYLSLLWGWIRRAADAYSRSLTGLSIGQVRTAMDRATSHGGGCAALVPAPLQTTVVSNAGPANEAGTYGFGFVRP